MQTIRLKRTNRDDLVFAGVLLSSVDDQDRSESNFSWLKLLLYQTSTKAYILGITLHRYSSSGCKDLNSAIAFSSIEDIQDFLSCEECRDISYLIDILLKKAVKTKKILKKGKFSGIQKLFDTQKERNEPDFAVASC